MENEYKKPLSEAVKLIMYKVMQKSTHVVKGFLFFPNRTIFKAHYDEEGCSELLENMIIKKANVLNYLRRKYTPTYTKDGAIFKNQVCIQKVVIKEDKSLLIHIGKCEPHKIITDVIHIRNILQEKGFKFNNDIKLYINQIQIAYQDTLLYVELLKDFGLKPPAVAVRYCKELLFKYGNIENVIKIKKRSVKRKFLRWYAKTGRIEWIDLRKAINIDDYSERSVRKLANKIRDSAKERGVKIDF